MSLLSCHNIFSNLQLCKLSKLVKLHSDRDQLAISNQRERSIPMKNDQKLEIYNNLDSYFFQPDILIDVLALASGALSLFDASGRCKNFIPLIVRESGSQNEFNESDIYFYSWLTYHGFLDTYLNSYVLSSIDILFKKVLTYISKFS